MMRDDSELYEESVPGDDILDDIPSDDIPSDSVSSDGISSGSDDGIDMDDSPDPGKKYRRFMIVQYLAPPFSDDWNDDRMTLKQGSVPLITEDRINKGLSHKSVKSWAWIWHDRDVYVQADEARDPTGRIHAGDRKFLHAHIVLDIPCSVTPVQVAKWFGVPVQLVKVLRGRGAFYDGVEYLVHQSPKAVEQGKTPYDPDEVNVSSDVDIGEILRERRARHVKDVGDLDVKKPEDVMRMNVLLKGWTMRQCREADPVTYARIKNSLPTLRLDFLTDADPCPFRLTIYIDGPGGVGKSSFARYLAESMFPDADDPFFCIGNDERVTFDGYDGQPCVIFDDMRAAGFISQFGRSGTFRLLDPNPTKTAQQAKYSRVILNNAVNIINGVEPYGDFIDGLAGNYTDRSGVVHQAEDEGQAWRRVPMILCIHSEDFDILVNEGFVNDDLESIKSIKTYYNVRMSLKSVMQHLDGNAKRQVLDEAVGPVLETAHMIEDKHEAKITDPADIPPEYTVEVRGVAEIEAEKEVEHAAAMAHYKQCEEEFAEERRKTQEEEERANEESYRQSCTAMLTDFCDWFWNAGDRYGVYSKTKFFKRRNGKQAYLDRLMTDDDFFEAQYDSALDAFAKRHLAGKSDNEGKDFIRITKRNMLIFTPEDLRYGLKCVYENVDMDFPVGHFARPS